MVVIALVLLRKLGMVNDEICDRTLYNSLGSRFHLAKEVTLKSEVASVVKVGEAGRSDSSSTLDSVLLENNASIVPQQRSKFCQETLGG